jgi:predicted dehydrogenase
MIHDIDLALALTGELPVSVEAFGSVIIGPHEDSAVARLRMPGGAIVDLTSSRVAPQAERSCQVWSTAGCTNADFHSRQVTHWGPAGQFQADPSLVHSIIGNTANPLGLRDQVFGNWIDSETIQADASDALTAELDSFLACAVDKTVPVVSGREAVDALRVADEVLKQMQIWSFQQDGEKDSRRAA